MSTIEIAVPQRPNGTSEQAPVSPPIVSKEAQAPKVDNTPKDQVNVAPLAGDANAPQQTLTDTMKAQGSFVPSSKPLHTADRVPSNWDIRAVEDGIEAVNTVTNLVFEGTIAEFNKMIKA